LIGVLAPARINPFPAVRGAKGWLLGRFHLLTSAWVR
jgi:hypothetical protein